MQFIRKIYNKITGFFRRLFRINKAKSRNLKLFISNKIILNFIRLIAAFVLFTALSSAYIYFYKPEYIGKIKYKTLSLLSRYANINFNKFEIVINGAVKSDQIAIKNIINDKFRDKKVSDSINDLDELVKEIKSEQKWIDSLHIFRSLPNLINVNIIEYVPFALYKKLDNYYVVDSNGAIIPIDDESEYEHLIVLSGKNAYSHVKSLFNIMAINPEISSRIYSATWVGNRRWDLRFDNSILIKMPSSKITYSWNKLVKLYNTDGSFHNLRVIDLRIKDKIYLEYKDLSG